MEDDQKLYDALVLNGVWEATKNHIPDTESNYIWESILSLAKEVTIYNNSVLGVLKQLSANKDSLDLEITDMMNKIKDPEALTLLKQLVDKTGLTN